MCSRAAVVRSFVVLAFVGLAAPELALSGQRVANVAAPAAGIHRLHATEQEWILSDVLGAIASMALPSQPNARVSIRAAQAFGKQSETVFDVTMPGRGPMRLTLAPHVWAPQTYLTAAQALFGSGAAAASATTVDLDARSALTNLRPATLLDENERISAHLQRDLRSAAGHEAAALLLASFALREGTGLFADVRPALARITAHLTIARALRAGAPAGRDGSLATIVLAALAGRQREAMGLLDTFASGAQRAADGAWSRALRLRITGDWRQARPAPRDTLLEHLEYARAVRSRIGLHAMAEYVESVHLDEAADPHRFAGRWYITEAVDLFGPDTMLSEIAELELVHARVGPAAPTAVEALLVAGARPVAAQTGTVRVQVLDWGVWSAFLQRHLCQALLSLRMRGTTAQSAAIMEDAFGRLPLYPIVLRTASVTARDHDRAMTAIVALARTRPELLPASVWTAAHQPKSFPVGVRAPVDEGWFSPVVPSGSGFELEARVLRSGTRIPATQAQVQAWADEAPYDAWVRWSDVWHRAPEPNPPAADDVRRALGPLLDYDAPALERMIDFVESPPATHLAYARTLCTIAPAHCHRLGEMHLLLGQDREALAAYEEWIDRTPDHEALSSGLTWVVRHYHATGQLARAEELALKAGRQESLGGLAILAELRERQGRVAEADMLFAAIARGFDGEGATLRGAFLMRRWAETRDASTRTAAEALLAGSFPRGLQRMDTLPGMAAPADGVVLSNLGQRARNAGLRHTDVIVAVDGWRVSGVLQYLDAIRFRFDETVNFVVWRDGRYVEVAGRIPERWLGTRLSDYQR